MMNTAELRNEGPVVLEYIDLWQSDYGIVEIPTEWKREAAMLPLRKDRMLDRRFARVRTFVERMNALARAAGPAYG